MNEQMGKGGDRDKITNKVSDWEKFFFFFFFLRVRFLLRTGMLILFNFGIVAQSTFEDAKSRVFDF